MTATDKPAPIPPAPESPPARLASIDAYRGFVMLLMMGEVLHFAAMAAKRPDSKVWEFLAHHQEHVEWVGCTLHDMIQPSFSFLVGVALPFSLLSRAAKGQSSLQMTLHAFWRAFVLVALGIFLRSTDKSQTNFTFDDTLTQIGLGYGFLYIIGQKSTRVAWISLVVILLGYGLAFALYPLPGEDFDYAKAGVPPDWSHNLTGFAAHWNKNTNLAWRFDTWFLNLFPRENRFLFHGGGYATLSFIPTLGTMIFGLIAGRWVMVAHRKPWVRVMWLAVTGLIALGLGFLLGEMGVCPVVKRIWTPSWTLYSAGWCFLMFSAFYAVLDVMRVRFWAFPLIVVGANSIAAYVMAHLIDGFIVRSIKIHLGTDVFSRFGADYTPVVQGAAVLITMWMILAWMYQRKIFIRV